MTLVLKLDLDIIKMYVCTKNEVPIFSSLKVIIWTNTQTDRWQSLQIGVATHFWATSLFSMRLVSLALSQSCHSIDAYARSNGPLQSQTLFNEITTWRSRSSQIAGSSTQHLLLCNNATFDDIILQHLMTSFCIRWHNFEWLAHFGFWINRGKKFIFWSCA